MSRPLTRTLLLAISLLLPLAAVHADEALSYDANGNVETRTLPWGTTQYGYDDLDRVTSEAGPARTQSFTYDANDNRLTDGAGSKTYTPNTDRLLTENGQNIVLDAAGNITQLRGLTLAWNQAGQLKSVSRSGTLLATYYYDYKGRRSRKVVEGSGSLNYRTTIYIHDLYDHLIGEFNGAGSPLRTYVWRDDIPVAIIDPGDRVLYLETDHLNTPIAARNQAGTVVWKWESDAFGATLPNEDPDGDGMPTTINLRFPGQYFDKESGFHYNHHRYYDPGLGRYLSPDPIGLAGGANLFGYVGGNPLSFTDPLGLSKFDQTFGMPSKFWNWYHRMVKRPGDPDLTKDEAKQLCDEWKQQGQPGPDTKRPRGERGEADPNLLEWLVPWWLSPSEAY